MIIAVIMARGGSKRIPNKNIKNLGGKPLIAYSILAAKKSKLLDKIIVSTDHQGIIKIAQEYGAEIPFVRPKELAEDVPSELVTLHAVKFFEEKQQLNIDIVVSIQPTTPFITPEDIDRCIEIVKYKNFDSSFSCRLIKEPPFWMFKISDNGKGIPFIPGKMKGDRGVFQELEKLYVPNGAIYVTKKEALFKEKTIITKNVGLHIMSDIRSIDIDEPIDFLFAEFIIEKGVI
jgi:CMP-N-acetylneuraminic acid synthetase